MNLQELLDELRTGILHDVSDEVDGNSSYLWTDKRLTRYINQAERRFARYGFVLMDGVTPEVTQVTLQAGVSEYALHPKIFSVLSAKFDTDKADLQRAGHSALSQYQAPEPNFFDPASMTFWSPGRPVAYATDELLMLDADDRLNCITLRVFPEPNASVDGKVIYLRVFRKPLEDLQEDLQEPEIPEDFHLEMLDWAAYLALRVVDRNSGEVTRAYGFRQTFENHVTEARNTIMRKLFAPTQWGFGKGGWTWER